MVDVRDDRRRREGGGPGRAGHRARGERSAGARRQARGPEPRRRSPGKSASPARRFSASSPRWRRKISSAEAQPGRGVRIGAGSRAHRRVDQLEPHRDPSSPSRRACATKSAKRSISQFCRAARRCSSTRFRVSSASSRCRAIGERFPAALHRQRQGDPRLLQQAGRAALIDKSVAEHPEHPLADRAKLLRELDAVATQDLAFDLGEHDVGISAVGAAVLDAFGRPVAVSIPAPTHRFNAEREFARDSPVRLPRKDEAVVGRSAEERQVFRELRRLASSGWLAGVPRSPASDGAGRELCRPTVLMSRTEKIGLGTRAGQRDLPLWAKLAFRGNPFRARDSSTSTDDLQCPLYVSPCR